MLDDALANYVGGLATSNSRDLEEQLMSSSRTVYWGMATIFAAALLQLYTNSLHAAIIFGNMKRIMLSRIVY
ncbi:MAG: hypothetical protein P4M11_08770 [Candidatus Pacebacteria bacterium]|nr:hypothetical protein [Candidatus Paceibacterota bacterium]